VDEATSVCPGPAQRNSAGSGIPTRSRAILAAVVVLLVGDGDQQLSQDPVRPERSSKRYRVDVQQGDE
jgi:hypothetical protein